MEPGRRPPATFVCITRLAGERLLEVTGSRYRETGHKEVYSVTPRTFSEHL